MEAYIDLSFIVFLFNFVLSFIYSLIIFDNYKYKKHFIIISIILGICSGVINVIFIPYFLIMFMVIYALIIGCLNINYLKIIITTLIIYYINSGFLLLIGGCFLYEGILLISYPFVTLFILLQPIYITFIHLLSTIIYKAIKYKNYVIKCSIKVEDKVFKGKGYYDSGNMLLYEDIPVIFIKGKPISNNGKIIKINGINDYPFSYLAFIGTIIIKNKSQKVYVVFIDKKINFNNCHFLLNKFNI